MYYIKRKIEVIDEKTNEKTYTEILVPVYDDDNVPWWEMFKDGYMSSESITARKERKCQRKEAKLEARRLKNETLPPLRKPTLKAIILVWSSYIIVIATIILFAYKMITLE